MIDKPIKWMLKQKLVYWEFVERDTYGKTVVKAPVEMECRWEDEQEEIVIADNSRYACKAHLYTFDRLALNSFVLEAELSDIDQTQTPQKLRAFEIVKISNTPGLRAKNELREAWV